MAEEKKKVSPGSWVGDTVEEFKKLPTWGKIVVGLVAVAVIWFAWYQYQQSKNAAPSGTTPAQAVAGSLLPPGAVDNGQGAPPSVPVPQPAPNPNSAPNKQTPLIPYDFFSNHQFPTAAGNKNVSAKTFTYNGTNYNVISGANGRIWGEANGQKVLLYGGKSAYGSGGMSMDSFMTDPILYLKSAIPHKTTAGL